MKFHGPKRPRGRPRGKTGRRLDLRPGEGPLERQGDFIQPNGQVWTPRYNIICLLASAGMKGVEIADQLGITPQTVYNVLGDPRAHQVIIEAQRKAAENVLDLGHRIKQHANEALDEVVDSLRHSKDERLRVKVGFGLLDRAGYTPIQRHVIKQAPTLPEGLVERVTETHAELKQITREFRYTAPPSADNSSPPVGRDLDALSTGTEG